MADEEKERQKKPMWKKAAKMSLGVLGGLSLLMGYISATGMQQSEGEAGARKSVDDFLRALNARNGESARFLLHYPHVRIVGNNVGIWNGADEYDVQSDWLGASEAWDQVELSFCTVRQDSEDMIHFEIEFSALDADQSRSMTYKSFWIVTNKDGRWGIQSLSTIPGAIRMRRRSSEPLGPVLISRPKGSEEEIIDGSHI
jgi:hypothetical protein